MEAQEESGMALRLLEAKETLAPLTVGADEKFACSPAQAGAAGWPVGLQSILGLREVDEARGSERRKEDASAAEARQGRGIRPRHRENRKVEQTPRVQSQVEVSEDKR